MLARFSKMLSSLFISKNLIKEDERNVYDYCFEIMLSTILNFLVILVISLITHTVAQTLLYIVSFMIVRETAGGYHAGSHLSCLAILVLSYCSFLTLLHILPNAWMKIVSLFFALLSIILVFILSPIEDRNKPLTEQEIKKYKKRSRVIILLLSFFTTVLSVFISGVRFAFSLASGMVTVSTSLIAGKIKNNRIKLQ